MEKMLALVPLVLVLACPLSMALMGLVGWFIARTHKRPTVETAALVHSETGMMVQPPPTNYATGVRSVGASPTFTARS